MGVNTYKGSPDKNPVYSTNKDCVWYFNRLSLILLVFPQSKICVKSDPHLCPNIAKPPVP